jgi:hypothetical protein
MKIILPTKKGNPNTNPELEFEQLVIVGANGSGKTRFGSRIEDINLKNTHRISAQKSLTFPVEVSPKSKQRAENEFLYGYHYDTYTDSQHLQQKRSARWGNKLSTHLLNDYEKLLVLLHTEEYEESLSYKEGRKPKPRTKLDIVQSIWEKVLPHRKLIKRAGVIETFPTGDESGKYNASEMSDGVRVIFYLIGEVVCSPENSILIIDEPEMHIHKSLVKQLFDLIENERPDCSFVYLTHDIDFAFTRQNAIKIWAKSYLGDNIWDYEFLHENMPIPEQLYLEVLGSRKPVIFLEGEDSSIDYELYEQVYTDHTLKPLGSCDKVIQSVKSFNGDKSFHHIDSFGIIDGDRRLEGDIAILNAKNIWILDVAEAENLLLVEEIIKALSTHLGKNQDEVFDQVKSNLIEFFDQELNNQILLHFKEILRRKFIFLSNFKSNNIDEVSSEIDINYNNIDKKKIFEEIKTEFKEVIAKEDYNSVLRLFNLKKALIPNSKVCELLGIRNKEEYLKLVITILKRKGELYDLIRTGIDKKVIKNAT